MNLNHEKLNNHYSSHNIIRVIKQRGMRCSGYLGFMGDKRVACRVLVGKPEIKRPLGRPRLEDNIKMDFIKWDRGIYLIDLAQDRDK